MQKLIKLDNHFYVVDDSEIEEAGIYYLDTFNNKVTQSLSDIPEHSAYYKYAKKITHSTKPLEEFIDDEGIKRIGWTNIKPLELPEVEEAIYGYDVGKMAESRFGIERHEVPHWKEYIDNDTLSKIKGYVKGFNAHKELQKDKLFTVDDIKKAIRYGFDVGFCSNSSNKTKNNLQSEEQFIQSLLPKTEWDIEFDKKDKIKIL